MVGHVRKIIPYILYSVQNKLIRIKHFMLQKNKQTKKKKQLKNIGCQNGFPAHIWEIVTQQFSKYGIKIVLIFFIIISSSNWSVKSK